MLWKGFEDFTEGNSRLSQNKKSHKKVKKYHICLGVYNSRLRTIIFTEMIEKHYSIVAYYM